MWRVQEDRATHEMRRMSRVLSRQASLSHVGAVIEIRFMRTHPSSESGMSRPTRPTETRLKRPNVASIRCRDRGSFVSGTASSYLGRHMPVKCLGGGLTAPDACPHGENPTEPTARNLSRTTSMMASASTRKGAWGQCLHFVSAPTVCPGPRFPPMASQSSRARMRSL